MFNIKNFKNPSRLNQLQNMGFYKLNALSIARHLIHSVLPAALIFILCTPLLNRSAWIDEAMLFSNYPIAEFSDLFKPLAYYDQAAPPIYSFFASFVANLDTKTVRSYFLFSILYSISLALLFKKRNHATIFLAFISISVFSRPLIMYSEMKHYGLEAVGLMISLTWLIYKDAKKHFDLKDIFILSLGMLLGISTLIGSVIAGALYFINRYFIANEYKRREIIYAIAFLCLCLSYYELIKNLTSIQFWNYPSAYENKEALVNINNLALAVSQLLGNIGMLAVSAALLILIINIRNGYSNKIIAFTATLTIAVLFLSAIGSYPVTHYRHVTWIASLATAIVFYGLYICINNKNTPKKLITIIVFGLFLILCNNTITIWTDNFEIAENKQAISTLDQLPKEPIGLWIGGQPIVQYYKRLYPQLNNYKYFGEVNPYSAKVELSRDLSGVDFDIFNKNRSTPGAWATKHLNIKAFEMDAKSLISQAPRGQSFYIFAANCDLHVGNHQNSWTTNIINGALSDYGCTYKILNEFKRAFIYSAYCPQLE